MQNSTNAKPTIKVEEKTNYGNTLYYVTDEWQRQALSRLTKGQRTLTTNQCNALVQLGFKVTVETHQPFTK